MFLKLINIKFIILLVLSAAVFYSCVDEPEIPPVTRPFTTLRVANFTSNISSMDISISNVTDEAPKPISSYNSLSGGAVSNNIAQENTTQYFDLNSGKRKFVIKDGGGNELFNNDINCISYEEMVLFFVGAYDPSIDLNSLSVFQVYNGQTYLDDFFQLPDKPGDTTKVFLADNELAVNFVHALATSFVSGNPDDEVSPNIAQIILINNGTSEADTVYSEPDPTKQIEPENQFSKSKIAAGDYTVEFYSDTSASNTDIEPVLISSGTGMLSAATMAYFVLTGLPSSPKVVFMDEPLLTARPK